MALCMTSDPRTFDELLDNKYGPVGTPERDAFEAGAQEFIEQETAVDAPNYVFAYIKADEREWFFKTEQDFYDALTKYVPVGRYEGAVMEPAPKQEEGWPGRYRTNDEPPIAKPYERNNWQHSGNEGTW